MLYVLRKQKIIMQLDLRIKTPLVALPMGTGEFRIINCCQWKAS